MSTDLDLSGEDRTGTGRATGTGQYVVKALAHGILIVASALAIIPFAYALLTSLKPEEKIFSTMAQIIPAEPTVMNYVNIWMQNPLDRWIFNSLLLSAGVVFFTLLLDSLAGYALAKGDFKGQRFVYLLVVGTLIVPPQAIVVPLYIEMSQFKLVNTYWAVMFLYIANPFGVFMMRQFFLSVPDSYLEAARMDGCSTLQIYTRIMLPMAKPALSSLAVFTFTFIWGAFLWPLIILSDSAMYPLQVGLAGLTGQYSSQWGQLMAAAIIAALPVITAYLLAQKTFMEGIALTGSKG
ncbi:sugar ABC transporter permease [Halogeometricum pallidum JCM 14848]|uniref:Sugar ABC transporter permease n=1 Tax=Halogeometricum pallidum JCM 14848 TaxID=1227487 RepID=M0DAY4_HALPD|nr:carbohydrate ABC transporter permease [Halogeometricum pallidum]ELZ32606.1 sugar ABC transporter permease [Halogeometricum pallidum JCM 14848]